MSVIMGAYNSAATLDEALESIRGQTMQDWEIVICDDGSVDGTSRILARWQNLLAERVTIITNDRNRGLAASLNSAIEAASGTFLMRMDADDVSDPHRMQVLTEFFDANPSVDLVGSSMRRFSERGQGGRVIPPARPDKNTLRTHVPFCHATVMARQFVFASLGYSEEAICHRVEDIDLWFRFFQAGFTGANIDQDLYLVREDAEAVRRRTVRNRWNLLRVMLRGGRLLDYSPRFYLRATLAFSKVLVPAPVVIAMRRREARP
ncbi:glycosyltransferase family 2 protein [Nocardioides sp. CFH 31398]|uniref:glycosyltransferase family 2 protein n=1 Tax=Nocardioides sp. CFH 31398 TaxID=2919579 RepID=UPI001F064EBC|nr:glycosyltransferase family 2 protein [Nocardioides sp. CFH 31398]MCH1865999.1 glycosyltransferase [Nocardioides sp. CFH 31398]